MVLPRTLVQVLCVWYRIVFRRYAQPQPSQILLIDSSDWWGAAHLDLQGGLLVLEEEIPAVKGTVPPRREEDTWS